MLSNKISLDNFEQILPAAVLQAGEKLWQQQAVEFSQLSANEWLCSFKQGRKSLQLSLGWAGPQLADYQCGCGEAPCAHLAAALLHFSLGPAEQMPKPKKNRKSAPKAADPVVELLQAASREQLEALLLELSKKDAAVKSLLQLKLSSGVVRSGQYYLELEEAVSAKLRTTKTAKPFKNMAEDWKKRVSILQKQKDAEAAESMWEMVKAVQKLLLQQVDKHMNKLFPFVRVLKLGYTALAKRSDFDQQLLEGERESFLLAMCDAYPTKYYINDDLQQLMEPAFANPHFSKAVYERFQERYMRLNDRSWSRLLAQRIAAEPHKTEFYVAKFFACCYERNWGFAKQLAALPEAVRYPALQAYFAMVESTLPAVARKAEYRELKEGLLG